MVNELRPDISPHEKGENLFDSVDLLAEALC